MKTKLQLVAILGIAALTAVFAQGPLTPPGAPALTMKTLDQIEPRTPINDTAVPGGADAVFTRKKPDHFAHANAAVKIQVTRSIP